MPTCYVHVCRKMMSPADLAMKFLTSKSLLLLIIAGGIALLYVHSPHLGVAVVAAITALALLRKMIS